MFNCYAKWGFVNNPFAPTALKADPQGNRLLVGREKEVKIIAQRLHKQGKITCLDGHVGVGKTSVANIAAYSCFNAYLKKQTTQLLIPCREPLELRKGESIDDFCRRVFLNIAQTLLDRRSEVRGLGLEMRDWPQLQAWLNEPNSKSIKAGVSYFLQFESQSSLNTGKGFEGNGFEILIKEWLKEIFQVFGSGGVVCVIDNVELLETSTAAMRTLEALRDRLFIVPGIRWVFCGANGVINSLAASQRIGAFLNTPILDVANIHPKNIEELLLKRIQEFAPKPEEAWLPLLTKDLEHLYLVLNFNLRDLLGYADGFCTAFFESGSQAKTEAELHFRYVKWLEKESRDVFDALSSRITGAAWSLLDTAMSDEFRGTFGIGDFSTFSRNTTQSVTEPTFRSHLREVVRHGLLSRSIEDESDDEGFKRDVYTVTAKGALVHFARVNRNELQSLAPITWLKRVHYQDN